MRHEFCDPLLSKRLQPNQITTAQGRIEYAELGDGGPPVIALHGAMGGYDQSAILAQTIGQPHYRYLAVSRPGYLGTPLQSGYSPEHQADLIASFMDSLNIGKACVMAVSGGGPCALQFALRHAARCSGLVLVSTCAGPILTPIPISFKIMMALMRMPFVAEWMRRKSTANLETAAQRSIQDPDVLRRTIQDKEIWPLYCALMMSTFDSMEQRIPGTKNDIAVTRKGEYPLESLRLPALVIHGTRDRIVPFEAHGQRFKQRISHAELLAIEGGEHVAIFTHHKLVRPKVREFMEKISRIPV